MSQFPALPQAVALGLCLCVLSACGSGASSTTKHANVPGLAPIVSVAELRALPAASPQRAVMTLWRLAQLGDEPGVVALYHPSVLAVLGGTTVGAAYDFERSYLIDTRASIINEQSTPQGELITIEETPKKGASVLDSFLLQQNHGTWRVAYDTFLERALRTYTEYADDPTGFNHPSKKVLQNGDAEAAAYRNVFLSGPAPATSSGSRSRSAATTHGP